MSWFIPAVATAIAMVALSPTTLVDAPRSWWRITAAACAIALVLGGAGSLIEARNPRSNRLRRDTIAEIALAPTLSAVVAVATRAAARANRFVRLVAATLVLVVASGATWFILLLVHCSSGDCL